MARAIFLGIIALGGSIMALCVALAPAPKQMSAAEIEQCSRVGEEAGLGIVEAHTYCRHFGGNTMMKAWEGRAHQ